MINTIFIILVALLNLLFLLFVFNTHIYIFIDDFSLKIKLFQITIIKFKGQKLFDKIVKMIPQDKNMLAMEIDIGKLKEYIHFDELNVNLSIRNDYLKKVYFINTLNALYSMPFLKNVTRKKYTVEVEQKSGFKFYLHTHFNIGTIIINVLLIRRQYAK